MIFYAENADKTHVKVQWKFKRNGRDRIGWVTVLLEQLPGKLDTFKILDVSVELLDYSNRNFTSVGRGSFDKKITWMPPSSEAFLKKFSGIDSPSVYDEKLAKPLEYICDLFDRLGDKVSQTVRNAAGIIEKEREDRQVMIEMEKTLVIKDVKMGGW